MQPTWYSTGLVIYMLLAATYGGDINKEKVHHEDHNPIPDEHETDGEHNADYDHDAVLGSHKLAEEYGHMSPEEASEKLGDLVEIIDSDSDRYVTKEELSNWITHSFLSLDEEEALEKMDQHDKDNDEKMSWEEYLAGQYGFTVAQVTDMHKDKNPEMQEYAKMVAVDKQKFMVADQNRDGLLDKKEFPALMHPWDFPHMHDLEMKLALAEHDKNQDGVVDFTEFLGTGEKTEEEKKVEQEQFDSFDLNKNKKLEANEIKKWVLPDHREIATEETNHLLNETDEDKDGRLTKEEIVNQYDLWVGSEATDYGRHLHDPEEL